MGISFLGLLTVLFVALKLTHVITWSWLWVLAPLWAPSAIILVVIFVMLVIMVSVFSLKATSTRLAFLYGAVWSIDLVLSIEHYNPIWLIISVMALIVGFAGAKN